MQDEITETVTVSAEETTLYLSSEPSNTTVSATITSSDGSAPSVSWISSDESVVTVTAVDGLTAVVKAVGVGTANVTAISNDGSGASGSVTITVDNYKAVFEDVQNPGEYYYKAVYWAYFHDPQITKGTSDTQFSPNNACTRAEVVTFLWRAAGSPEPTITEHPFTDVKAGTYYYKAMLWAVEQGVTKGTSDSTFSPYRPCSRGEVVTFLWRAMGKPAATISNHSFTDVKEGAYYYKAMLWAVEQGVTKGTSETTFSPTSTCSRGEVVTFLYRAMAS